MAYIKKLSLSGKPMRKPAMKAGKAKPPKRKFKYAPPKKS